MNKTRLIAILALSACVIAGCSQTAEHQPNKPDRTQAQVKQPAPPSASPKVVKAAIDTIQGHINQLHPVDDSRLIIGADRLYLFDTKSREMVADTERQPFHMERYWSTSDGYIAFGRRALNSESNDTKGESMMMIDEKMKYDIIFYDRSLQPLKTFDFGSLLGEDEEIISSSLVSFTKDGRTMIFATQSGLYRYQFDTKEKVRLIDLTAEDRSPHAGLSSFDQLAFTNDDQAIAFKALSFDLDDKDNPNAVDTCGMLGADGKPLSNKTFDEFSCKEMTAFNNKLLFAEDIVTAKGTVMVMDVPSGQTTFHQLTTAKESGVVTGSDKGEYFATSLGEEKGWTIRIYSTATGELVAEQFVDSGGEELYMANNPLVQVADETRTCVIVLGAKQNEIAPKLIVSQF
ncbi:transcriptional regulator [Paenibacillus sp. GCM10027626]|uniref:transcriptional regulator n=1 Tax=Paenibacillus sp. GCM10027626 TaxID=3273411 RepID=UPI00362F54A0